MKRTFALVTGLAILGAAWFAQRGSQPASSDHPHAVAFDDRHTSRTNIPILEATPRASDEWQGMAIDELQPSCDTSERCGLATACIAGRCGGCIADGDCASGE